MQKKERIPWISPKELIDRADIFLSKVYPSKNPPVPIEKILEKLHIRILAIPNLKKSIDKDAYVSISRDIDYIIIDEEIFDKYLNRSRFTCAHEVAHLILHREIYEKARVESDEDYIEFQNSLKPGEEKRLEIQAHILAGYILMPRKAFRKKVDNLIHLLGGDKKITVTDMGTIIDCLAQKFNLSKITVYKQLTYEYPKLTEEFSKIY